MMFIYSGALVFSNKKPAKFLYEQYSPSGFILHVQDDERCIEKYYYKRYNCIEKYY